MPYWNSVTHSNSHSYRDCDVNSDRERNSNSDRNRHSYSNVNRNCDGYSHGYRDCYRNSDGHAAADTDAETTADAASAPIGSDGRNSSGNSRSNLASSQLPTGSFTSDRVHYDSIAQVGICRTCKPVLKGWQNVVVQNLTRETARQKRLTSLCALDYKGRLSIRLHPFKLTRR